MADEETQARKPSENDWKRLRDMMQRANDGEQKAIDELRQFLNDNHEVSGVLGNLCRMAEKAWIELLSNRGAVVAEAITRQMAQTRADLVGDSPSAIEKLLADQVTATLLETRYLETISASATGTPTQLALLLKRLDSAQRRHLNAVRSLVQTRKLLREEAPRPGCGSIVRRSWRERNYVRLFGRGTSLSELIAMQKLNPQQREAAQHGDAPLLIIAGAGTGKTATLAHRVAHLIGQGVSPARIMLLTFTRRAAAEMLRRADVVLRQTINSKKTQVKPVLGTGKVWGGTFHAAAVRFSAATAKRLACRPISQSTTGAIPKT